MGHFIPNQKLFVLGCPLVICCLQCPMSEALLPRVLCTREYLLTVAHTVHVASYLRKSADFRGNLSRISVKVCAEIRGSSVASPQNRRSGSAESSFGNSRNCLSGAHGFVLWESSKQSLGDRRLSSPQNCPLEA